MVLSGLLRVVSRVPRSCVATRAMHSTHGKGGKVVDLLRYVSILHDSAFHYSSSVTCQGRLPRRQRLVRYYTKKHEWVSVHDGVGTVGISNYAQDAIGEVVFVQLPYVGNVIKAGAECGALESLKAASELYSPVSGTVSEKNDAVETTPFLINKSCYDEGWLFRVEMTNSEEVLTLMDQAAYDKFLAESH